jgi:hypothetical protein
MTHHKLFVFALLFPLYAFGVTISSHWLDEAIADDSKLESWDAIPQTLLDKLDISVCTANDSNSLYLSFRFTDQQTAFQCLMRGIYIWFDKKKNTGIAYHGDVAFSELLKDHAPDRPENDRYSRGFDRLDEMLGSIQLISKDDNASISQYNKKGISAGCGFENGIYFYTFKIPLHSESLPISLGKSVADEFSICFEFGGDRKQMQKEMEKRRSEMQANGEEPSGRGAGGMGGGRSGGRGGGMGGGMSGGRGEGMGGDEGMRSGGRGREQGQTPSIEIQEATVKIDLVGPTR